MKVTRVIGSAVAALSIGAAPIPTAAREPRQPSAPVAQPKRITLEVSERPLRELLKTLEEASGVALEPMWKDQTHTDGLDPEAAITLKCERELLPAIMDRLLKAMDADEDSGPTWQKTSSGAIQLGPRSRLNAFKRTEVYDIADLLRIVPSYTDGPTIDLQQALQGSGAPITNTDRGSQWLENSPGLRRRGEDLVELIQKLVEPSQWEVNGGGGGTLILHDRSLIVRAPGYIHRALHSARD